MTETTMKAPGSRIPFSFELYPPKSDAAASALTDTIDRLASVDPDFISVTYGAGGSSRTSSLDVLRYILRATEVDPMAHLTCVGSSTAEASRLIREFLDADLIDTLHVAVAPNDLGRGERLWDSPDELLDRYHSDRVPSPSGVTHHLYWRR